VNVCALEGVHDCLCKYVCLCDVSMYVSVCVYLCECVSI